MTEWIETYRGVVSAWECDIVEHFTIAYYFDRFADATRNHLELLGVGESLRSAAGAGPSRLHTIFAQELRAGAAHHMLSAVTGVTSTTLSLGHQVVDSTSCKTVTWVAETLALPPGLAPAIRGKLECAIVTWPGPKVPEPPAPPPPGGMLTARDRVKPWEVDEAGRLSLPDHVHRFSGAGMHFLTSIGMTGAYMLENRRGFSTFLLDTRLVSAARAGERVDVSTAVEHVGNTSLRYVHRMTAADDRLIATMVQAGVHLDLDARRPCPIPDGIRAAVAQRLARGG